MGGAGLVAGSSLAAGLSAMGLGTDGLVIVSGSRRKDRG